MRRGRRETRRSWHRRVLDASRAFWAQRQPISLGKTTDWLAREIVFQQGYASPLKPWGKHGRQTTARERRARREP